MVHVVSCAHRPGVLRLARFLGLVVAVLVCSQAAFATSEEIALSEIQRTLDIRDRALVFRDDEGTLDFEDIQRLKSEGQFSSGVESINRFTDGPETAFWFYFRVQNDTDHSRQQAFYLGYDRIDWFDYYLLPEHGLRQDGEIGFFRPVDQTLSTNWFPFVSFDLAPGETVEVYGRVGGAVYLHMPLKVANLNAGLRTIHEHYVIYGIIFGTMLAAIAYLAVLWQLVPGRYIPTLIGFICAAFAYAFIGSGISRDVIGYAGDETTRILITVSVAFIFIFGMMFARAFLEMRKNLPTMDKLFVAFLIPCGFTIVLAIVNPPLGHFLISVLSPIGVTISIVNGLLAIHRRVPGARPYFLCYATITVGGFFGNAIDLGLVPANGVSSYVMFSSFAVSGLALSITVANRIRVMQQEVGARLRAVFNTALNAIITVDQGGRVLDYNAAAEKMFGMPRDQVLGEDVADLFLTAEGVRLHRDIFLPRSHDPNLLEEFIGRPNTTEMRRADGTVFPVEVAVTSAEANGETFYTSQVRDMTSVREMEEELEAKRNELFQSEKLAALGSLLAGVAHELNNPLSVVIGRASMLRDLSEDEKVKSSGEKILDAAQRCARIVRSFLAMARQRPIQKEVSDLNALVAAAVELVNYNLTKESVELQLNLKEDLPTLSLDPDQITQVTVNLIVNACHAMSDQESRRLIRISTDYLEAGDQIVLAVEDSGPGVPDDIRKRVFDPFFTTKQVGKGTGLGLSVSQGMIEAHGGTLGLSESILGGACFRITLPRDEAEEEHELKTSKPESVAP